MANCIVRREQIGEVFLVCNGPGTLSAADFELICESASEPGVKTVLGLDAGPNEITSVQRKRIADIARDRGLFVIIVTNERMTRGIVTALSWLGANVKAFSWDDIQRAVDLIGDEELRPEILRTALQMRKDCGQ